MIPSCSIRFSSRLPTRLITAGSRRASGIGRRQPTRRRLLRGGRSRRTWAETVCRWPASHSQFPPRARSSCVELPALTTRWVRQVDEATCFGVHICPDCRSLVSRGEIQISRITLAGDTLWRGGGPDIFTGDLSVTNTERLANSSTAARELDPQLDVKWSPRRAVRRCNRWRFRARPHRSETPWLRPSAHRLRCHLVRRRVLS